MTRQSGARNHRKSGAAAIELAILSPFLLLVVFAIIEFGWLFMARQMVHHAAAEGARWAILVGNEQNASSDTELATLVNGLLVDTLGITPLAVGSGITRDPATDTGDPNEVITVSVPLSEVALPGFVLRAIYGDNYGTQSITFTVTMAHPSYA